MTRVAAIDLGTNSTRLLVADIGSAGCVHEVERRSTITGMGQGIDTRGRLLPLPIARVRNCLAGYRNALEGLGAGRALVVATSAVRDAENGEAFLGEVEWSYGFATRLLSGEEEAALTFDGVATGGPLAAGTLVVDVGGGSTELVLGGPAGLRTALSLDVGSVRLTERFLAADPPAARELAECSGAVQALMAERVPEALRDAVRTGVGVAGTVTTLATLDLGLEREEPSGGIHGHLVPAATVERELGRLASLPLAERRGVRGLEPARAPTIVAGMIILREAMAHFGLETLEASERDLLHGAALAAAELPEPVEWDAPPGAYTCC